VFCTKCGLELPDDSQFCRKCGSAFSSSKSQLSSEIPAGEKQAPSAARGVPVDSAPARANSIFGTLVFSGLSLLTLAICFAKGIVPIYLAEAGLWAALALLWHKKHVASPVANGAVLLLAVALAAGEGFLIGRQPTESYTYLQQGNFQFRVNARSGRTDRLTIAGWEPVSFDRPAEILTSATLNSFIFGVGLKNGNWAAGPFNVGPGEICFDVENLSDYVLRDVTVVINLDPKPADADRTDNSVTLTKFSNGLLGRSATSKFCGKAPRKFPDGSNWSFALVSATGWKEK
jgi:hypothetical protein